MKYLILALVLVGCTQPLDHKKVEDTAANFCRCHQSDVFMIQYFSTFAEAYCDNHAYLTPIDNNTYVRSCE